MNEGRGARNLAPKEEEHIGRLAAAGWKTAGKSWKLFGFVGFFGCVVFLFFAKKISWSLFFLSKKKKHQVFLVSFLLFFLLKGWLELGASKVLFECPKKSLWIFEKKLTSKVVS